MCIHKCYIFQCGDFFFTPGALIVCDLATITILTPPSGNSGTETSEEQNDLQRSWHLEAAAIPLPKDAKPGVEQEEEKLKTEWPDIKGFSGVCNPMAAGYSTYNIERLCKDCQSRSNEVMEAAKATIAEARREGARLRVDYPTPEEEGDTRSLVSMDKADTSSLKTESSDTKRRTSGMFSLEVLRRRDN